MPHSKSQTAREDDLDLKLIAVHNACVQSRVVLLDEDLFDPLARLKKRERGHKACELTHVAPSKTARTLDSARHATSRSVCGDLMPLAQNPLIE